jgi:tetratricopeptide (TPR) repeat protein
MHLAEGLGGLGELDACLQYLARAVKEAGEFGRHDPRLAKSLNALGLLHCRMGNGAAAERALKRAAAIYEKALAPDHPDLAALHFDLAGAYELQDNHDAAALEYERALALAERSLARLLEDVALTLDRLGEVYLASGRRAAAQFALRHDDSGRSLPGQEHPSLAGHLKRLAQLYSGPDGSPEAELLFTGAVALLEKALGRRHREIPLHLAALARTCREQARFADAHKLLELALAILEKALHPDHPATAVALEFYSEILRVLSLDAKRKEPFSRAAARS